MYEYQGVVHRVVDGDSLVVQVDLGLRVHTIANLRLAQINAPEMSTPEGKAAREALLQLCPLGTRVRLATYKDRTEKYGRWLAKVWLEPAEGDSLNELMVHLGHARQYDGGAR